MLRFPRLQDATRWPTMLMITGAVAACGGDSSEADPTDTVAKYIRALADADAPGACAQLGVAARRDLARYMQQAFPEVDGRDCPASIRTAFSLSDPAMLEALRDVKVQPVDEDGDTATVRFGDGGQLVRLRRTDGAWKIARLSFGG